ncbi:MULTISPECIES: ATP-binding response regulator [Alphaproteobacteria]|uniref:histidine kinase n=2 Tax=Alphaproteobacteria TaxID=28211 RepID=A0A512HQ22_9HYPH|nr:MULTISPECIES: PAS-domain containing protein [Alphaproteobacteria]GEO87470.1 hybrid sensor histidine kinase/response regulator [Ciceribacter naphthalenivorans]GLR23708.1 hybrid sensor histidine kinase/response regulator [Ciceribacter naphthalenivorans]GLT06564.1 hybrid sensor histidine kinase/response regulator [Sphingomonas psychrolutea]
MINPDDPYEVQIAKQAKIIEVLIKRAERGHEVGDTAYALFQSAITLQAEVWEKTKDLEKALDTLGRASNELEIAYQAQERIQRNLADAMVAMEGGFALFCEDRLQVCNSQFRELLPDVEDIIKPGLAFDDYLTAVNASRYLARDEGGGAGSGYGRRQVATAQGPSGQRFSSFVMALRNDRWFQISYRQTSSDNMAVLQTEITDLVRENRREKNRLIDQQAHLLQAAFDHMSLGVCTFSSAGELLVRNERFGALLGIPLPLLKKGTRFQRIIEHVERHEILDRRSRRAELTGWFKALLHGETIQQRFRRRDGMSLDIRVHSLPDDGFILSIMDVTAETEAAELLERRVQERTAELTEANRMLQIHAAEQAQIEGALRQAKEAAEAAHTSKTRFLAAASHDLLQPINAAKLYLSMLSETVEQSDAKEVVGRLNRSFNSIETLLQALLDISRLDSSGAEFNVTSFSLGVMLQGLAEDLAPLAAEKGIRLTILPTMRWVTSDQRYLMRCVQNLVVNAIQYTERGRVLVGCRLAGNKLRIEVWDTGMGICEEDQVRVFKEFTRGGGGKGTGMGLGLSIVERACRHLDHPVKLVSRPGHGSMFSIEVPLAPVGNFDSRENTVAEIMPDGGLDLIVMVVENDADELHAMTRKLENWGASVLAAASTAEAVSLMQEIGTPPDILLADYQLDDADTGVDTIQTLRAMAGEEIPAVIISANRQRELMQLSRELSFSVLNKPVQLVRLRALIDWQTRGRAA